MSSIDEYKTLLEEMRDVLRSQGYAYATETSYCDWVSRFIRFHKIKGRAPMFDVTVNRVEVLFIHLAVDKKVTLS